MKRTRIAACVLLLLLVLGSLVAACSAAWVEDEETRYYEGYYYGSFNIRAVAVGDVDLDGAVEVVAGGSYWDGARSNALLHILAVRICRLKTLKIGIAQATRIFSRLRLEMLLWTGGKTW